MRDRGDVLLRTGGCPVGELDNERYGIVVRSTDRDSTMGGALPRMPGMANEWQQFWHAWRRNAKLYL